MATVRRTYNKDDALARLKKLKSATNIDPDRFIPGKATATKTYKYVFLVLAPLEEGDACYDPKTKTAGGKIAQIGMDGNFTIKGGVHWYSSRPYGCPRIQSNDKCLLCDEGFELLKQYPKDNTDENKKIRSAIGKNYLGKEQYFTNIYFPPEFAKFNPPEVNGRVMYAEFPQAVLTRCEEVLSSDPDLKGKAAGIFYDPACSYPLEMVVKLVNGYNNYESSSFLSSPVVLAPTDEEIDEILSRRHYLFDKIEPVKPEEIIRIRGALLASATDTAGADTGASSETSLIADQTAEAGETLVETVEAEVEPEPAPAPVPTPAAKPAGLPSAKAPAAAPVANKPAPTVAAKPAVATAKPPVTATKPAAVAAKPAVATKPAVAPKPVAVKPAAAPVAAATDDDEQQLTNILAGLDE